jgi:hypothetical protein
MRAKVAPIFQSKNQSSPAASPCSAPASPTPECENQSTDHPSLCTSQLPHHSSLSRNPHSLFNFFPNALARYSPMVASGCGLLTSVMYSRSVLVPGGTHRCTIKVGSVSWGALKLNIDPPIPLTLIERRLVKSTSLDSRYTHVNPIFRNIYRDLALPHRDGHLTTDLDYVVPSDLTCIFATVITQES